MTVEKENKALQCIVCIRRTQHRKTNEAMRRIEEKKETKQPGKDMLSKQNGEKDRKKALAGH